MIYTQTKIGHNFSNAHAVQHERRVVSYTRTNQTHNSPVRVPRVQFLFLFGVVSGGSFNNKFLSISMGISAFTLSQCRPFTYILLDIKQQSVNQFAHKNYIGGIDCAISSIKTPPFSFRICINFIKKLYRFVNLLCSLHDMDFTVSLLRNIN